MTAAVIPVKRLFEAKSRLSPVFSHGQRRVLCLGMLRGMLTVMSGCPELATVAVISPDEALGRLLSREFPHVRFLLFPGDLNQSATYAGRLLAAEGYQSMLFALGDLPLLTVAELEAAMALGREHPAVLMPDRHGRGTNAVLLSPPDRFRRFFFGPDSLSAHRAAAWALGLEPELFHSPGFAWDVDNPEDLAALQREVQPPEGA